MGLDRSRVGDGGHGENLGLVPGPPAAPAKPRKAAAAGPGVKRQAAILAFIGASGSGKSRSIRAAVEKGRPRRLVIWDPMDEYGDLAPRMATLAATFEAAARGYRARYVPPGGPGQWGKLFEAFCIGAYAVGGKTGDLWVIVEELADVTTASHAPAAWARISRSGRHKGLTVLAATQRPATVDKSFLGNASRVRCFRLNWATDVRVMAALLGVPDDELMRLTPGQWIDRDLLTGRLDRGALP